MTEQQAKILIVDDEIKVLKRMQALLTPKGYQVITAPNGAQALQQASQELPDLVLLDARLPDLSGYEICRRLKSDEKTYLIPVLFVTVLDGVADRIKGFEAGADDFLTKPVHSGELLVRISNALRLKQSIDRKFESLSERIQQVEEQKSLFFTSISHEARTQLDAIIGFSEVLQEQTFGNLNETQREYVEYVLSGGIRLLELFNGLLDLSKIESDDSQLQCVLIPVRPLLDESLNLIKGDARARAIDLSLEISDKVDVVYADEQKVRRILFYLLTHALKSTPRGKVGIRVTKISPTSVQFTVWDTGMGISWEDQQILQELPQLGKGKNMKVFRTGFGLALAKKYTELHGQTINIESTSEHGSVLNFSLPSGDGPSGDGPSPDGTAAHSPAKGTG